MKIRTQISLFYVLVLLLSFTFTFTAVYIVNEKYVEKEAVDFGNQTIKALDGNLQYIFENVTQFSNLIYFDQNVQNSLARVKEQSINPSIQHTIQKSLVNMLLSGDYISTAYIFDQYYNDYNSRKVGPIIVDNERVTKTNWYKKIEKSNGQGFFIHKSEDILTFPTRSEKNYITYVREIRDADTYEHLAILLLTIDAETLQTYFNKVSEDQNSEFFIIDSKGNYIIPPENPEKYEKKHILLSEGVSYRKLRQENDDLILMSHDMGIEDWKLVGAFPISHHKALKPYYTTVIVLIIVMNLIFTAVCFWLLTKLIFSPLSRVERHLKMVEEGEFKQMEVSGPDNEINNLKRVFNSMVEAIRGLIEKVKLEEQEIARGKLALIQAQINPHFLYNTLDAISALVLTGDGQNAFKMTQALGGFYRNSLNSGRDFITVKDELEGIKDYITILNIRHDNQITFSCDVEEALLSQKVLKLILQPVVENSINHGIRKNGMKGSIRLEGYQDEDEMIFIITDDGWGMEEERIEKIFKGETVTGKSGFGLYSLRQRISLCYGIENPLTIHSEAGNGTEVTIRVKVQNGEEV